MNKPTIQQHLETIRKALYSGQISAAKVDAQRALSGLLAELGEEEPVAWQFRDASDPGTKPVAVIYGKDHPRHGSVAGAIHPSRAQQAGFPVTMVAEIDGHHFKEPLPAALYGQQRVATSEQWLAFAGEHANEIERAALVSDQLPACARAVLDGLYPGPEYWQWLADRWQGRP